MTSEAARDAHPSRAAAATSATPAFSSLALPECVRSALSMWGHTHMTPVQAAVLPLFAAHKDVAAQACTGSGKTLAFLIPTVTTVLRAGEEVDDARARGLLGVLALVLSPTRELAKQTYDLAKQMVAGTWVAVHLCVGGTDVNADIRACVRDGAHVLVGTPGRVLDLLTRARDQVPVNKLEMLIMDEADTLLDMGFADTLSRILQLLPKQRRTGLFSATQTQETAALIRAGMRNPVRVCVDVRTGAADGAAARAAGRPVADDPLTGVASTSALGVGRVSVPSTLANTFMIVHTHTDKLDQLCAFMRQRADAGEKTIVFVLTCAAVDFLAAAFSSDSVRGYARLPSSARMPILPLHGQMPPKKRTANYEKFLHAETAVLLCTDVAARGIDVPDVDWIVQYDAPKDPSFFVHRVGRTARAGRSGCATIMLTPEERSFVDLMRVKNVKLREVARLDDADPYLVRNIGSALQDAALQDRDIMEKGTHAFMAFMRGYSEHLCKYIFKMDSLNISDVAYSYGLLKLPKLDELRRSKVIYEHARDVDTSTIAFADPNREAQRQKKLAESAEAEAAKRAARDARRDAALAAAAKAAAGEKEHRKRSHKGVRARLQEDWDILAEEERLEKRLRKGRISKAEFSAAMARLHAEQGVDSDDELRELVATAVAAAPAHTHTHDNKRRRQDEDDEEPEIEGDAEAEREADDDGDPEDAMPAPRRAPVKASRKRPR